MAGPTRSPAPDAAGRHVPVLVREAVAALNPLSGAIFVDGTFGRGGYARALLEAADCVVWGIDRDPQAIAHGAAMAAASAGRLHLIQGRFGAMREMLRAEDVTAVDGIVLDLGVSSPQLEDPARGFSFTREGPLDMRMDAAGPSAADVVNTLSEQELSDLIHVLGEERQARRIARAIVTARAKRPIRTTTELAVIVAGVVRPERRRRPGAAAINPATRTFQALRIHVNDEFGELDHGLAAAELLLRPGGRLAVVSFHSLEDRRVKQFLRARSGGDAGSRHRPAAPRRPASFRLLQRRAIRPSTAEVAANARARSARLRAAERTDAPARTTSGAP